MKQILPCILFVILTLSVSAQTNLREVDLKVNDIGEGSPYSFVISKFGEPRLKDVKAKFGQPNSEAENSNKITLYYVMKDNAGIVNFEFLDKKLVKITMKETLC